MGEEEKKPAAAEEGKKAEESAKAEKPAGDAKKEEKKSDESKEADAAPPPPTPPQEIILKVFMHCEACARKVRRCLEGFEGVEEVITDCRTSKVIVKGEKADPVKVLQRVQKKSHRQVELISPIPKPPAPEPPKQPVKDAAKPEEKKEEVITVVLRVYMHCDACAQEIKRRIQRMKGVENAEPDLKNSKVTTKGIFEPEKLCEYVYRRTGKHATIIEVEPEKKEAEKGEEPKEEKKEKAPEEGEKDAKKGGNQEGTKDTKEAAAGGGAGEGEPPAKAAAAEGGGESDDQMMLELRKNEVMQYQYRENFQMYPQRYAQEMSGYPPQMFSDENPNACSVM